MCGIYGCVGENAISKTLTGIKKLEYRGYDSAGIGFFNYSFKLNDKIKKYNQNVKCFSTGLNVIKSQGEIDKLDTIIKDLNPKSGIAIGHTRWATHGKPSVENCHPHYSENGNFIVVHNGIIENYLELKNELKGLKFYSQTDTEIIAKMLSYYFNGSVLTTLKKVCEKLKGSYALCVINAQEPNKIYVAKCGSPCVVGIKDNCGVVCSDLVSVENANLSYVLPNNTYATVTKNLVTIFNQNLEEITLKNVANKKQENVSDIGDFSHFMLKEITETPSRIIDTISNYNNYKKFKNSLPKKLVTNLKDVLIIGCGTAYHAGLVGKHILERENINVRCEIASEFVYSNYVPPKRTLAIFVSQSGETADTIKAVKLCKAYGLKTVALTNVKNSSICFETDYQLYTYAGKEVAVASTKAYNCQLTMFYLLCAYIKAVQTENEDLVFEESKKLIEVSNIIKNNKILKTCKNIANDIYTKNNIYMIGRGLDYYLALESSLKLKEISYIHTEAYPAGELKHGTISLIDSNTFVFGFNTQSVTLEKTLSNINEVLSRDGKVIVFATKKLEFIKPPYKTILVPNYLDEYMPLIVVGYMQLIAYYTALNLNLNPDKPRSLAKSVTVE